MAQQIVRIASCEGVYPPFSKCEGVWMHATQTKSAHGPQAALQAGESLSSIRSFTPLDDAVDERQSRGVMPIGRAACMTALLLCCLEHSAKQYMQRQCRLAVHTGQKQNVPHGWIIRLYSFTQPSSTTPAVPPVVVLQERHGTSRSCCSHVNYDSFGATLCIFSRTTTMAPLINGNLCLVRCHVM